MRIPPLPHPTPGGDGVSLCCWGWGGLEAHSIKKDFEKTFPECDTFSVQILMMTDSLSGDGARHRPTYTDLCGRGQPIRAGSRNSWQGGGVD